MFPDLLDSDVEGNLSLREALALEGEVQRAEMRAAARATLLRHDVQAKLRRALRMWPKGKERDYEPGELVYFYAPKPPNTRFKKEPGFWRGPAMILGKESHQRFFVSWRGRCLLVSASNLRAASRVEGGDYTRRLEEVEDFKKSWKDDEKQFEGTTGAPAPEDLKDEKEEAKGWEAHDGIVVQGPGRRPKSRVQEIAKALRGMKTIKAIETVKRRKGDRLEFRIGWSRTEKVGREEGRRRGRRRRRRKKPRR